MKNIFCALGFLLIFLSVAAAFAQNKVVVIPLNKDCVTTTNATGDAQPEDVLAGKTFSNSSSTDLVGTMVPDVCTGDAQVSDVLTGKTFSNSAGTGLTGTLEIPASTCTGDARAEDVLMGKTFSNAEGVGLTGTLNTSISSAGDAQPGDVLAGKTFSNSYATGLVGTLTSTTQVAATGQVTTYAELAGQPVVSGTDGDVGAGAAWPVPRFADNGDGTVTDNLTGLVWLKDAGCMGELNWADALDGVALLASGTCGLTDSSTAGAWRMPNINEISSLLDYEHTAPMLSDTNGDGHWSADDPFTNVASAGYWSSTTMPHSTYNVYGLDLNDGMKLYFGKNSNVYWLWPVRDAL